jgi:ABC-2 type transport system ATP-binding protein
MGDVSGVVVEGLVVRYGDVVAVDDVSFAAGAGRVTCVLGPNGAGKTSTVECLEGLRRPAAGRLSVLGLDPATDRRALAPRVGVMLQEGGAHPAVRALEALRHAAALYPRALDPAGLVERLGLGGRERRTWRQLSGGEQRRLALGLALVGRPEVAFLDEPTAGVDPAGRQVIREVVRELRDEGVAVVLTTHDLDEAERVADDVVVVDRGRLVAAGTMAELVGAPGAGEVLRFSAPPGIDVAGLADHLGATAPATVAVAEVDAGRYEVAAPPTPATVAAVTAWLAERDLPLADLQAGRQRLEDVFLALTSGASGARAGERADRADTAGDRADGRGRRGRRRGGRGARP